MLPGPVMLDVEGTELTQEDREILQHPAVGGLIFFARNFESAEQIAALSKDIRAINANILIAVDQEGGRVQRFKEGFVTLPAAAKIGQFFAQDIGIAANASRDLAWLMASELLAVGVDFSFAPVLDLNFGLSSVIGDRAFAESADSVTRLTQAWMAGARDAGMISVGKHFPGHGGVTEDSHLALPIDKRSLDELSEADIEPFKQLIAAGLEGIMPAHVIYQQCDDQPAGFSKYWLQNILREQLNFDGVIFSDDLSMEGAAAVGGYAERAQAALDAGCDMVLVCNNRQGAIEVLDALASDQSHQQQSKQRLAKLKGKVSQQSLTELHQNMRWTKADILAATIITGTEDE